jgi:branched-chain amino acid transport system permease protein
VLVRGTRFGKIVVSVINDRESSIAVGINVNRIYTLAFTLGTLCAALGDAAVAPIIAVATGFAVEVGVQSFAVIAIGGMGSLEGAVGALLVGNGYAHYRPSAERYHDDFCGTRYGRCAAIQSTRPGVR